MANVFDQLAKDPSPANVVKATGLISDAARKVSPNILKKDGGIVQTERLFSARARYAATTQTDKNGLTTTFGDEFGGSRGDWAYIRLLTSTTQAKEYITGSTKRDLTFKDLVGSGSIASEMAESGAPGSNGYDRFLITSVGCQLSEKVQISEVFGDNEVVYYFGRQPIVFNISGILIDSPDNNWFTDWLKTYSDFLRGSQTAKNYELIKLVLPNMTLVGTMSAFTWQQDAARDVDIPFSFQFIAKTIEPKPATGPLLTSNRLEGINFAKASIFSQADINDLKGQTAKLIGVLADQKSSLRDKGNALTQLGSGVGGGFGSFLESSRGTLNGFQKTVEGWNKQTQNYFDSVKKSTMFKTVTSSLEGIRTNLFSPIYGILSSLTKLVSNTFNSANNIVNSLINPVRNILRDITNISNKAIALVNQVNNSITGFGRNISGQLKGVQNDYKTAIKTLGKAAGVIASAPITADHSVRHMFQGGVLTMNTPFLRLSPKSAVVRPSLTITKKTPKSKVETLTGGIEYSSQTANTL